MSVTLQCVGQLLSYKFCNVGELDSLSDQELERLMDTSFNLPPMEEKTQKVKKDP